MSVKFSIEARLDCSQGLVLDLLCLTESGDEFAYFRTPVPDYLLGFAHLCPFFRDLKVKGDKFTLVLAGTSI
jgi:hypothetical protein